MHLVLIGAAGAFLFGIGVAGLTRELAGRNKTRRAPYGTSARPPVPVPCVASHSENGLNYPWLRDIHGGLEYVEFEEPVGSGHWRRYDDHWWAVHCRAVSHRPGELVQAHVRAFIDPATRFARLAFHFHDGAVLEPEPTWYQLEADWARLYGK
jgi:hypothetical protein